MKNPKRQETVFQLLVFLIILICLGGVYFALIRADMLNTSELDKESQVSRNSTRGFKIPDLPEISDAQLSATEILISRDTNGTQQLYLLMPKDYPFTPVELNLVNRSSHLALLSFRMVFSIDLFCGSYDIKPSNNNAYFAALKPGELPVESRYLSELLSNPDIYFGIILQDQSQNFYWAEINSYSTCTNIVE